MTDDRKADLTAQMAEIDRSIWNLYGVPDVTEIKQPPVYWWQVWGVPNG